VLRNEVSIEALIKNTVHLYMSNKKAKLMKSIDIEIKALKRFKNTSFRSPYYKDSANWNDRVIVSKNIENKTQRLVRKRVKSYFLKFL